MDDSIQLQEEEMSLDSIQTLPPVTMEVPSTPVSCYLCITSHKAHVILFFSLVQESRVWRWVLI